MIYFIQAEGVGNIKIGFTDGPVELRLADLQTGCPVPLRLLHSMPGTQADEKDLHRRFASARVTGEWFKPIPDLMALIPSVDRLACGGAEVVEQSVSIRVLTVGRKQFTRTLLQQLPEVDGVFAWNGFIGLTPSRHPVGTDPKLVVDQDDMADYTSLDHWGWVDTGSSDRPDPARRDERFRWLIHVFAGRLCKSKDYLNPPTWEVSVNDIATKRWLFACVYEAHRKKNELPGYRDRDQLFIGV